MSEFPHSTFSSDRKALFSPEEVRGLMNAECARATRYAYPVTAMRIAVDRLDQLGDLYGYESRDEILAEVTGVIRNNTRESDFLGYKIGGTFHAIFPHTDRDAGPALARRLLNDTAQLTFEAGNARVQVTLSIGVTYRDAEEPVELQDLTRETGAAIDLALKRGGNRFEVYYAPDPILDNLPNLQEAATDRRALTQQLSKVFDEKLRSFFASMGQAMPDFGGRELEVLALAVEKMESTHQQMREEHAQQVSQLQRRLNKVTSTLAETEGRLRQSAAGIEFSEGVASIYRTVQGLSGVENDIQLKKEMMAKIFEANVELRSKGPQ